MTIDGGSIERPLALRSSELVHQLWREQQCRRAVWVVNMAGKQWLVARVFSDNAQLCWW